MVSEGMSSEEVRKKQRRKWIRYEWEHSNSLWHTDWHEIKDPRWKEKQLIVYEDDASRFVVGYGVFDEATTENAISVLQDCIKRYGRPPEPLTDHGSQFYANSGQAKPLGVSMFEQYLLEQKIDHILGRVNHPQTNGKIERSYETFQSKVHHFDSVEDFVTWYNMKKPHVLLNWEELETPIQAFYRKVDGRRKLPFMVSNPR